MADSSSEVTSWDPDPVYELGNALIAFGDLLDDQRLAMETAQFNLINGSWSGQANMAMTSAFENGLSPQIMTVIEQFWNAGEAINYYAMLRTEQQATEKKEALASMLGAV